MNKLAFLFYCLVPLLICAQTRSHIEALQEAYDYCKTPWRDSSKLDTVSDFSKSIMEFKRNGNVYLYAVHIPEKNICVFVSNEKQYTTIIGSMSNEIFPLDSLNAPPALLDLLEHHMDMIDSLHRDSPEVFYHRISVDYQDTMSRMTTSYVQGQSLLKKNELHNNWNQSCNNNNHNNDTTNTYCDKIYNRFCPTFFSVSCGRTVTGCSAVAMGQVLWYWNWPDYALISDSIDMLGGAFLGTSRHDYDWANIPEAIYDTTPSYQAYSIASLLRDCGYAAHTIYSSGGSAAEISYVQYALGYTFHMHTHRITELSGVNIQPNIITEINALRPVICQATERKKEKGKSIHTFVIDGYRYNNGIQYHINWGWGIAADNSWFDIAFNGYETNRSILTQLYPDCDHLDENITGSNSVLPYCVTTLFATNSIILNQSNNLMYVYPNGHLIAQAGNSISLRPGFHAISGSEMRISIRDFCQNVGEGETMNSPEADENNEKSLHNLPARRLETTVSNDVLVQPNPAEDRISIQIDRIVKCIFIYDYSGRCVLQTESSDISIGHLPPGMYIVRVYTSDGQTLQSKFVHK